MGRPPGVVGRTQLKPEDLVRIQTLSRDARMGPTEIRRVTGYSIHQIKYALKKKTPTVGKRTGRPRKGEGSGEGAGEGAAGTPKEKRRREKAGMGGEHGGQGLGQGQNGGLEQGQSGDIEGCGEGNGAEEGLGQRGNDSEEEGMDVEKVSPQPQLAEVAQSEQLPAELDKQEQRSTGEGEQPAQA